MRVFKLFSAAEENKRLDVLLTDLQHESWTLVHVFDQDKVLMIKDMNVEELLNEQEQDSKPKSSRRRKNG